MASWSDVTLILPYVVLSAAVLLAHRRMLDVLRVGEEEAGTLGIHPARTRLIVVAAATLGTAAAVSVSGLIGFVGIIVAHTVRLTASASYRIILPVAMIGGAAFLIGRPRRPHRPGSRRDAHRRGHGLHRCALLPRRSRLAPGRARHRGGGHLMAGIIRLAERRGRRGVRPPEGGSMVEFDAVSVRFGARPAVDAVTASVGRGSGSASSGRTGPGRRPSCARWPACRPRGRGAHRGQAHGRHVPARAGARSWRTCPSRPSCPPTCRCSTTPCSGARRTSATSRSSRARIVAHCARLLERLGLAELASRRLSTLSGGERQRVVLARALAQEAPVLLLDEPTSALDLAHRVEALEIVDELRREWGLTVVSALHDLTLAGQFADRLLLLAGGSVAALGTPAEVLDEVVLEHAFGCAGAHHPDRRRRAGGRARGGRRRADVRDEEAQ